MKTKTLLIILMTALLTAFLTVNNDPVDFNFFIGDPVPVSKLLVIGICIVLGFILGFLAGRPRKTLSSHDAEMDKTTPSGAAKPELSDEDRDYIG